MWFLISVSLCFLAFHFAFLWHCRAGVPTQFCYSSSSSSLEVPCENLAAADFLLDGVRPSCLTCVAVFRLLLSTAGHPCLALAMHRLLLSALRFLHLHCPGLHVLTAEYCRGLHVLPVRLSLHVHSSQARRWLGVRTTLFWTLRFCFPLLLSWDLEVYTVASILDLWVYSRDSQDLLLIHILTLWICHISWNVCTLRFVTSLVSLRLGTALFFSFTGSGVPIPGCLFAGSWVPIPGCLFHGSLGPVPWLFSFHHFNTSGSTE